MAVKRRIIWLSDEEWALLQGHAKEHHTTISGVIRDMWRLAAKVDPASPAEAERIRGFGSPRPAPKPSKRR